MSEMISMKCGCEFENGQAVADKVRMKGFADREMPQPATINCSCGETYTKTKLIDNCPNCKTPYEEGQKFCLECGTKLINEE